MLLTGVCNFKCPYCRGFETLSESCGQIGTEQAMMGLSIWIAEGLRNVRFSGGEPTYHPELGKFISFCKSGGVQRIAISTNGSRDFSLYEKLIGYGVNDFSISLDACCASFGDKMAGVRGKWDKVTENIKRISEVSYVTVGIVLTDDNVEQALDTVRLAHDLGVADIRIISAAQYNELLRCFERIDDHILDAHPILKYRVNNICSGRNVRGITETDCHRCHLIKDDSVIAGNKNESWHFPCVIYMREGGRAIGKVHSGMREDRIAWFESHDTFEDPICRKNCLDVCIDYNNKCQNNKGEENERTESRSIPVVV